MGSEMCIRDRIESPEANKPAISNLDDADLKSGEIVSLDEFRDKK